AWTTDLNIYTVPVTGGAAVVLTNENKSADQNPGYSPDGKLIAYASPSRGGFESDRWRLMIYARATKSSRELPPPWDRNADAIFWAPDNSALYVMTSDAGRDKLYRVSLDRTTGTITARAPQLLIGEHNNTAFSLSSDGRTLVWMRDATEFPAEIYT